jgi:hypothetical protein
VKHLSILDLIGRIIETRMWALYYSTHEGSEKCIHTFMSRNFSGILLRALVVDGKILEIVFREIGCEGVNLVSHVKGRAQTEGV